MTKVVGFLAITLTALLLAAMVLLAVRGLIDPAGAAASFGVGVENPAAALYHGVYRSRNLIIAVVGIVFLVRRMWPALAILTTVSIALPLFDIALLNAAGMSVTVVHPATAAALVLVAALQWGRLALNR